MIGHINSIKVLGKIKVKKSPFCFSFLVQERDAEDPGDNK